MRKNSHGDFIKLAGVDPGSVRGLRDAWGIADTFI